MMGDDGSSAPIENAFSGTWSLTSAPPIYHSGFTRAYDYSRHRAQQLDPRVIISNRTPKLIAPSRPPGNLPVSSGIAFGGSVEVGVLAAGAAGQGMVGTGDFPPSCPGRVPAACDGSPDQQSFATAGGFVGAKSHNDSTGLNYGPSYPATNDQREVLYGSAGLGLGVWLSNARSKQELEGTFETTNVSIGVGAISGTISIAQSGPIWPVTALWTPIGSPVNFSFSRYPTNTWVS
jgi:hypothetical protein